MNNNKHIKYDNCIVQHNKKINSFEKPFIVGICGATGSGKSYVCEKIRNKILETFGSLEGNVAFIKQDSFYNSYNTKENPKINYDEINYDEPNAINFKKLISQLSQLISGEPIDCPIYDFNTHSTKKETERIYPARIIIIEGILIFTQPEIRKLCDLPIFIFADESTRLFRRLNRDVNERGRPFNEILERWKKFIRESEKQYVNPSKKYAQLIINNDKDKDEYYQGLNVLLDLLVNKINKDLNKLVDSFSESELRELKELIDKKIININRKKVSCEQQPSISC